MGTGLRDLPRGPPRRSVVRPTTPIVREPGVDRRVPRRPTVSRPDLGFSPVTSSLSFSVPVPKGLFDQTREGRCHVGEGAVTGTIPHPPNPS